MKKTKKVGPLVCAVVLASTATASLASSRFDSDADSEINRSPNGLLRGVLDEAPTLIKDPDSNFSAEKYRGSEFAQHTKKILKPINDEVLRNDLYQEYIENIRNDSGLYDATKQGLLEDTEFQEYLAAMDSSNSLGCAYESTETYSAEANGIMRAKSTNLLDSGNTRQRCTDVIYSNAQIEFKTMHITITEAHSATSSAPETWTSPKFGDQANALGKGCLDLYEKARNTGYVPLNKCTASDKSTGYGEWTAYLTVGPIDTVMCEGIVNGVKKEPDISI